MTYPAMIEDVIDLAKGRTRLQRGKEVLSYRLTPKEWVAFELARDRGFVMDRRSCERKLVNLWFLWCEVANIPYLTVEHTTKRAWIAYDLIAQSLRLAPWGVDRMQDLEAELWENRRRWRFLPGSTVGELETQIEKAVPVAKRVLKILLDRDNQINMHVPAVNYSRWEGCMIAEWNGLRTSCAVGRVLSGRQEWEAHRVLHRLLKVAHLARQEIPFG